MSAVIFPAGFILGPIALVKEIRKDNSKRAKKLKNEGGNSDLPPYFILCLNIFDFIYLKL
jgi:hypothetical protein